jgi:hypothetical protein
MGLLTNYRKALTRPEIPRVVAALFLCQLSSGMVGLAMLIRVAAGHRELRGCGDRRGAARAGAGVRCADVGSCR